MLLLIFKKYYKQSNQCPKLTSLDFLDYTRVYENITGPCTYSFDKSVSYLQVGGKHDQ